MSSGDSRFGSGYHHPDPFARYEEAIEKSLSPDGNAKMKGALDYVRKRFGYRHNSHKATESELNKIVAADTFVPEDFVKASSMARSERDAERAEADRIIAEAISRLSREDRMILSKLDRHR